ncbi:MAG: hypothetical protein AB1540_03540 [Bdellovibrionota bacterium]
MGLNQKYFYRALVLWIFVLFVSASGVLFAGEGSKLGVLEDPFLKTDYRFFFSPKLKHSGLTPIGPSTKDEFSLVLTNAYTNDMRIEGGALLLRCGESLWCKLGSSEIKVGFLPISFEVRILDGASAGIDPTKLRVPVGLVEFPKLGLLLEGPGLALREYPFMGTAGQTLGLEFARALSNHVVDLPLGLQVRFQGQISIDVLNKIWASPTPKVQERDQILFSSGGELEERSNVGLGGGATGRVGLELANLHLTLLYIMASATTTGLINEGENINTQEMAVGAAWSPDVQGLGPMEIDVSAGRLFESFNLSNERGIGYFHAEPTFLRGVIRVQWDESL